MVQIKASRIKIRQKHIRTEQCTKDKTMTTASPEHTAQIIQMALQEDKDGQPANDYPEQPYLNRMKLPRPRERTIAMYCLAGLAVAGAITGLLAVRKSAARKTIVEHP